MNDTVVIAGGGTTGLMLACELGLAGVETVVLEAAAGPRRETPAAAINTTSVELLDQRGLMDALSEDSMAIPVAHFALLWLDTEGLGGRYSVIVNEARMDDMLRERATELGVKVLFDHRVASVRQDEAGVTTGVRTAGGEREISSRYLVGCDGADSAVRELAGIAFPGSDPPFYGIVGDVTVDMSELDEGSIGAFRYPGGGVYMGAPLGPTTLRVVTAEFDTKPPPGDGPVLLDELLAHLRRLSGLALKVEGAQWLSRYGNATRNAAQYRAGRVFLGGDAAHTFFPLGGLRLNACMQDAVNLGWKLAARIHGWAPPGLLDTYHAERHPVGERVCQATAAQSALMQATGGIGELREMFNDLLRFDDVNRYLLEFVTGLDVRYPIGSPDRGGPGDAHPLLGRRLGPVPITTADGETTTAAALHSGIGVVFDFSGGEQDLTEVAGWAGRVAVVTASPTEAIAASALLVRPDGHVAWIDTTAKDAEGLGAALTSWFGAPGQDETRAAA